MLKVDRFFSISWYLLLVMPAISIVISVFLTDSQHKVLLKFIGFGGCKCNVKIKKRSGIQSLVIQQKTKREKFVLILSSSITYVFQIRVKCLIPDTNAINLIKYISVKKTEADYNQ